jgi:hypothetical protein
MRCRYACSNTRVLRSCNLLPNVPRPIAGDSSVLRLVVSVANYWGSSLVACLDRLRRRLAANRVRLSRRLDEGIAFWSAPAPATQCIALSTRQASVRTGERPINGLTQACDWRLV